MTSDQKFFAVEDGVLPRFYTKAVKNNFKSKAEGRDVFENVEFVEILIPGDKRTAISQRVRPDHINRFKNVYKAFKEGSMVSNMGTPIDSWSIIDPATKATLKYMHILTIEMLAELPDSMLANVGMGARDLRDKARRHVQETGTDEATKGLREERDELLKRIEALEANQKPVETVRRGRPRAQPQELPPHMQAEEAE